MNIICIYRDRNLNCSAWCKTKYILGDKVMNTLKFELMSQAWLFGLFAVIFLDAIKIINI